jgi:hypothetical protein
MKKHMAEELTEDFSDELNEESKGGRAQILLRVSVEEKARFTELGSTAGFLSVSKFIIEAMNRYGDIIAETVLDEDRKSAEVRKSHRDDLRRKLQSPESS